MKKISASDWDKIIENCLIRIIFVGKFDINRMLNRRILRIKAFKTVYALAENPTMTPAEAQAQLEASCQSTRDLYLFMLAMVPALTSHARERIEAARRKFHPTEEESNPNMKFVDNAIAATLAEDPDFKKIIARKKLQWDQYDAFLWSLYDSVKASGYYADYMASGTQSAAEDAALWTKIFENELVGNTKLEEILEAASIWWNDDLAYALTACCHEVAALAEGTQWKLPELYLSQMQENSGKDSDADFVRGIVNRAVLDFSKDVEAIAKLTPKWDITRICTTDLALIVSGMAESAAFPSIPVKIIMNEYVEISKYYSTPESRSFVNGLLDKLINTNKQ